MTLTLVSYLFTVGDIHVWEPSNGPGKLYLGMIAAVADFFDLPTGLTDWGSGDWFLVDPISFPALVEAMLAAFAGTSPYQFRAMLTGPLTVSLHILNRAGIDVRTHTSEERTALAELGVQA